MYTYKDMCVYIPVYIQLYEYLYLCNYTFSCNRLSLIKICLCCFLDIHLYSNNLSTIATISSLIISELLPACFSCNNIFNLSQSSLGSDSKNIVEIPEAMTAGDLSNFLGDLSLSLFRPFCLI